VRVVVDCIVAWLTVASVEVDSRVRAEEVVNYEVELLWARRDVVVVKVVVGTHCDNLSPFFLDACLWCSLCPVSPGCGGFLGVS
jgi:hypothetical protein